MLYHQVYLMSFLSVTVSNFWSNPKRERGGKERGGEREEQEVEVGDMGEEREEEEDDEKVEGSGIQIEMKN